MIALRARRQAYQVASTVAYPTLELPLPLATPMPPESPVVDQPFVWDEWLEETLAKAEVRSEGAPPTMTGNDVAVINGVLVTFVTPRKNTR
jgi:hypothetical protein